MKIRVPPSKSITHRALFCAAMARGKSVLINPLVCDDTLASVDVLEKLGIAIFRQAQDERQEKWIIHGGTFKKPSEKLFCNESGTTYRFVTALTDVLQIPCEITGKPSLLRRPQRPNSTISSQYLSGLLLAEPFLSLRAPTPVIASEAKQSSGSGQAPRSNPGIATAPLGPRNDMINDKSIVSKPYIDLTLDIQKKFIGPTTFEVEADWSSAAYPLAMGVLCDGVELEGLNPESLQGDKAIVTILKEMGGKIFWKGKKLIAEKSKLKGLRWNFDQTPDLYPIVSVLCALSEGKSELTGLERLRLKESDRVAEMQQLLTTRYQVPSGNKSLVVDSTDHRVIMAAAVLKRATKVQVIVKHPEFVAKSWPGFWNAVATYHTVPGT